MSRTAPDHIRQHIKSLVEVKRIVNHEDSVARCGNCLHFAHPDMSKSVAHWRPGVPHGKCRLHGFRTTKLGCCDTWSGAGGDKLEPGAP